MPAGSLDAVRSLLMRRCLRSLGLLLQYFQESLQGVAVAGCSEAGHRLRAHGGQPELVAQLPDPLLYGHCVRHQGVSSQGVQHQATSASRES